MNDRGSITLWTLGLTVMVLFLGGISLDLWRAFEVRQDLAAMAEYEPDLAIGTTPVVQKAKEAGTPALYFTNLISARPLMGVPGPGSLAQVVNAAMAQQERFDDMKAFFEGVGDGATSGIWEDTPKVAQC